MNNIKKEYIENNVLVCLLIHFFLFFVCLLASPLIIKSTSSIFNLELTQDEFALFGLIICFELFFLLATVLFRSLGFLISSWNSNPLLKYLAASFVGALAGLVLADFLPQTLVVSTVNDAIEGAINALPTSVTSTVNDAIDSVKNTVPVVNITVIINNNFNFTFAISGAGIGAGLYAIWRKIKGKTTEEAKA